LAGAQDLRNGKPNTPFAERVFGDCKTYINYNGKKDDSGTITLKDTITPRETSDTFKVASPVKPPYTLNWHDWLHGGISGLAMNFADWLRNLDVSKIAYACFPPTFDGSYTNRADTVTITANRTVSLAFTPVLGLARDVTVHAASSAAIVPRSNLNVPGAEKKVPIRPWGMFESDFINNVTGEGIGMVDYGVWDISGKTGLFGASYTIKINEKAPFLDAYRVWAYPDLPQGSNILDGWRSNFVAVNFSGSTYDDSVVGYIGKLSIGDEVTTKVDGMGDAQKKLPNIDESPWAHDDLDGKYIFIVPIISDPSDLAVSQTVTIKGFAAFMLTENPAADGTIKAELLEATILKGGKYYLHGFGKWGITKTVLTK
jgi:hypothetical protein